MSEQGFITECERLLTLIEDALDASGIDVDFQRMGQVLEIEFDNGSKIVVNGQAALREMWLASPAGAHHFKDRDGQWLDTRSGESLEVTLSRYASSQSGESIQVALS